MNAAIVGNLFITDRIIKERNKMKVKEKTWIDFSGKPTTGIYLDTDGQYTISEFIELLQEAKEKWGDLEIVVHDTWGEKLKGFSTLYINNEYDEKEKYGENAFEGTKICINV